MIHAEQSHPRSPTGAKRLAFWRAFVVSVLVLWAACFASGVNRGYYLISIVAALLMALKYSWIFRTDDRLTSIKPPLDRTDSLREQFRPQAQRSAAIWAFMAFVMLVPACMAFLTGFTAIAWRWRIVELEGRTAILFGFVCLFIAARAAFGAYESLLVVRTLNHAEAEALTAHARHMTYAILAVAGAIVLVWMS